ncbi:MAG TPA: hypothetical protein VFV87_11545 [Pirellulaceae bacterium]|nr:hypothetical protein [Pirellulaceae bacterium]
MKLDAFLAALFDHGRVQVLRPQAAITPADEKVALVKLQNQAAVLAAEFPGQPPPLFPLAALWAATSFYRACQLAVYRDLDAQAIEELLGAVCPAGERAARHGSVDIVFRYLPDLVRHASAASQQDPLVAKLRQWAADWPLSSVGMAATSPRHEDDFTSHPGLVQLYVDRILAKKDWSRLAQPMVAEAVRRSLGAHGGLWPDAAPTGSGVNCDHRCP